MGLDGGEMSCWLVWSKGARERWIIGLFWATMFVLQTSIADHDSDLTVFHVMPQNLRPRVDSWSRTCLHSSFHEFHHFLRLCPISLLEVPMSHAVGGQNTCIVVPWFISRYACVVERGMEEDWSSPVRRKIFLHAEYVLLLPSSLFNAIVILFPQE
jgi:hypothetical protein